MNKQQRQTLALLVEWLCLAFANLIKLVRDGKRSESDLKLLKCAFQAATDNQPRVLLEAARKQLLHDKLLAVRNNGIYSAGPKRRNVFISNGFYSIAYLADQIAIGLCVAARNGQLTQEQQIRLETTSRADLVVELLSCARTILLRNMKRYAAHLMGKASWKSFGNDRDEYLRKQVWYLSLEQMRDLYQVEDPGFRTARVHTDNVVLAHFLHSNGLGHMEAAKITEKDYDKPLSSVRTSRFNRNK
jgi:hypothetical protein